MTGTPLKNSTVFDCLSVLPIVIFYVTQPFTSCLTLPGVVSLFFIQGVSRGVSLIEALTISDRSVLIGIGTY